MKVKMFNTVSSLYIELHDLFEEISSVPLGGRVSQSAWNTTSAQGGTSPSLGQTLSPRNWDLYTVTTPESSQKQFLCIGRRASLVPALVPNFSISASSTPPSTLNATPYPSSILLLLF